MGQTSTQTSTTTIPGAGKQESTLMALMAQLAQRAGGQLGDLSGLAQGKMQGPSAQDYELVQGTIGRTGDMAQREMQRILGPMLAKIGESQQGRGITGGSITSLDKILAGREMGDQLQNILSGAQQQGGQALMNLPFQRAETQMGANQLLFNMLTGAANPVLANALQARMAQQTTTTKTKQPFSFADFASLGSGLSGIFGAIGGGGGTQAPAPQPTPEQIRQMMPNPYTGRF